MNTFLSRFRRPSVLAAAAVTSAMSSFFVDTKDSSKETTLAVTTASMCEASSSGIEQRDGPKLIFLGSGNSIGCPVGTCTMNLTQAIENSKVTSMTASTTDRFIPTCHVSHLALRGDPKYNKDYRNNPSFLIHHYDNESERYKNIIIDVGKTFREGAMRWFPEFKVQSLDVIILTHEHMDAVGGLDDVRGFQRYESPPSTPGQPPRRIPVPLYLSQHCHEKLQNQFPFLLPKTIGAKAGDSCCDNDPTPSPATTDNTGTPSQPSKPIVHRDVAGFDVKIFQAYQPMHIEGLTIIPLPVWHGDDLISYGFAFSIPTRAARDPEGGSNAVKNINVVYISDISRMVPETMDFIQKELPPTDILVVDALLWRRQHPTHYSLEQAVELRNQIQPRLQTYLVGMSCENFPPHEEMETYLKSTYGNVTMAHDGLVIPLEQS